MLEVDLLASRGVVAGADGCARRRLRGLVFHGGVFNTARGLRATGARRPDAPSRRGRVARTVPQSLVAVPLDRTAAGVVYHEATSTGRSRCRVRALPNRCHLSRPSGGHQLTGLASSMKQSIGPTSWRSSSPRSSSVFPNSTTKFPQTTSSPALRTGRPAKNTGRAAAERPRPRHFWIMLEPTLDAGIALVIPRQSRRVLRRADMTAVALKDTHSHQSHGASRQGVGELRRPPSQAA